jgi:hypothetical protein
MSDTEAGLLPGELLLWTGRPARARVMPGDLAVSGVLLAALLFSVFWFGPHGSVTSPFGPAYQALAVTTVLAALIAATVRALRVKPAELRRTVYQVTDRRVLITTGPRRTWAAFLDQLAEPVVIPQRDGTADLSLRDREKFSLRAQNTWQVPLWTFTPGASPSFPVLRGLPDAEVARQVISAGQARMLRGALDVSPVPELPGTPVPVGFVPAPGERIVWTGCPQNDPWWFGAADIALSAYGALFVIALGFMVSWAVSTGAPRPLLAGFVAFAVVGFGYPAAGRVLRRRARIKRSVYIVTNLRLITTWAAGGRTAGTQSPLAQLLPPEVKDGSVFMHLAWPPPVARRGSWDQLMWPAAGTDPPQLIGLPDPRAVADLISSAQLAERAHTWQLRVPRAPD